ncbi:MAG: sodium:solute symporter family protein [Thermoprotei archaeon]|nr:sodium:solute symporter family protein [Thermoprotei archaeon]
MVETWQIVISIILLYIVAVMIISYVATKILRRTLEDFYILSRGAGLIVLFLATASTYHSAFAFLTSVAVFSTTGVTFWIGSFAWTTLAGIVAYVLGKRIYLLGKSRGYISPSDLLADRYNSELLRVITALVWAVFIIGYITVQAIGLGIIMSVGSGGRISYEVGALILVLVAALYVAMGGLRAAYWTDVLQGIWMYLGVWLAGLLIAFKFFPSISELFSAVREVNPKLLTLNWAPELLAGNVIVFGIGVMILPHLWIKFYAARDTYTIKWNSALTALYISSFYIPAMLVGLTAAVLNVKGVPGLLEPGFIKKLTGLYGSADAVMAYMIYVLTHPIIAGFLLAGAAAAAMSTLDSFLGTISLVLTRDIYQRVNPRASETSLVLISRLLIILFGLIGWVLAIQRPGLIFDIVAVAAGGGLQVLPALLQAVIPTRIQWINKYGAIIGLIVGSLIVLIFSAPTAKYIGTAAYAYPAGQASLYALIVNFIVAVVVSQIFKSK